MGDILRPRLRDNRGLEAFELYPIGQIPRSMLYKMCKRLAYLYFVGNNNLSGTVWGDVFAEGIGGTHLDSPVGIADVIYKTQCWSSKTIHNKNPERARNIRIIIGRCDPDYSYGITDQHENIQRTGSAALQIMNERINIAREKYKPLRTVICIRNFYELRFCVFEKEITQFVPDDYEWRYNKKNNLEAFDNQGRRHFTWQFHGKQLTEHCMVPASAISFTIRKPDTLSFDWAVEHIGIDDNWVTFL